VNHWSDRVAAAVDGGSVSRGAGWILLLFVLAFGLVLWFFQWTSNGQKRNARVLGARPGWSYAETDDSVLVQFEGWPFTVVATGSASDVTRGVHRRRPTTVFSYHARRPRAVGMSTLLRASFSSAEQVAAGTTDLFHGLDLVLGSRDGGSAGGRHIRVVIVAMEMPAALPGFLLRNQLPTDAIVPGLRSCDLDLGATYFDDAFLVRAEHPQLARDLLPPANQDLLLHFSPYARGPHAKTGLIALTSRGGSGTWPLVGARRAGLLASLRRRRRRHHRHLRHLRHLRPRPRRGRSTLLPRPSRRHRRR
jgi:hypothetical protein